MSDPPALKASYENVDAELQDPKTLEEGGADETGLILVKEGYFRYIDILFEWCKYMNPWQVSPYTNTQPLSSSS